MSQPQLQSLLPILQNQSDNGVSLTSEEWEGLFHCLTELLSPNKRRKNLKTDVAAFKIIEMMTYQYLDKYEEANTRAWNNADVVKAHLTSYILDVVIAFAKQVDGPVLTDSHSTTSVVARLLSFICATGQLVDLPPQSMQVNETQSNAPTAQRIRNRAIEALAAIIKALSGHYISKRYVIDPSDFVRSLFQRCLKTISGMYCYLCLNLCSCRSFVALLDLMSNFIPMAKVGFISFSLTEVSENALSDPFAGEVSAYQCEDPRKDSLITFFQGENSNICIKDKTQLTTHLHDLLQILAHCLTNTTHWSMEVYFRETVLIIGRMTNLVLSGTAETHGIRKTTTLKSCLLALRTLRNHHMSIRHRETLSSIPMHILRFRVKTGPSADWKDVDDTLLAVLDDREIMFASPTLIFRLVEVILHEEWGAEGDLLRVSKMTSLALSTKIKL